MTMKLLSDGQKVLEELNLPDEYLAAMGRILYMFQWPVAPDGTVVDATYIAATAAYHLARCGFDLVRDPLIHKQLVSGPGIIEGACQWPEITEDNSPVVYRSPLDDLENMTLNQINALPEPLKREAYRKLGWKWDDQEPAVVTISDAPEPDDGAEWVD